MFLATEPVLRRLITICYVAVFTPGDTLVRQGEVNLCFHFRFYLHVHGVVYLLCNLYYYLCTLIFANKNIMQISENLYYLQHGSLELFTGPSGHRKRNA